MNETRHTPEHGSKKDEILQIARRLKVTRFTPSEFEQIRLQMRARLGPEGKTSVDYIASVLEDAGLTVVRSLQADTEGRYEEEFEDLLHFSTVEDAEICLVRLDELMRQFDTHGERVAVERVKEVARLGKRRAEMIARNRKVDAAKRAEKEEIGRWFGIWLATPDAFFDWLEVRKTSPEYLERYGPRDIEKEGSE
jgi:hypothetical protein